MPAPLFTSQPRVAFAGVQGQGEELAERLVAAGLLVAVWDPLPLPAGDFAREQVAPIRTPRHAAELWNMASVIGVHVEDADWTRLVSTLAIVGAGGRIVLDCRHGALPSPHDVTLLATCGIGLVALRDGRSIELSDLPSGEGTRLLQAALKALGVAEQA